MNLYKVVLHVWGGQPAETFYVVASSAAVAAVKAQSVHDKFSHYSAEVSEITLISTDALVAEEQS